MFSTIGDKRGLDAAADVDICNDDDFMCNLPMQLLLLKLLKLLLLPNDDTIKTIVNVNDTNNDMIMVAIVPVGTARIDNDSMYQQHTSIINKFMIT